MSPERFPISDLLSTDFLNAKIWHEDGLIHIDVSALPAPDPFVAALRLIEHPGIGDEIVFHNDREPVHLFTELLEQGWTWRVETDRPGEFRMRVIRESMP